MTMLNKRLKYKYHFNTLKMGNITRTQIVVSLLVKLTFKAIRVLRKQLQKKLDPLG